METNLASYGLNNFVDEPIDNIAPLNLPAMLQDLVVASLVLRVTKRHINMPAIVIQWNNAGFNDVPGSPNNRNEIDGRDQNAIRINFNDNSFSKSIFKSIISLSNPLFNNGEMKIIDGNLDKLMNTFDTSPVPSPSFNILIEESTEKRLTNKKVKLYEFSSISSAFVSTSATNYALVSTSKDSRK
ncbi:hypothetical protein C1645_874270 [Glomus cerebriforme]|uniref:Uncharacterized protein n=1 Tax=Glomus cerebriforme TaxID=658196 RepID=A0A397T4Q2_9GLOM|nr:hypothetical protein C1645_874270 [Glomus cerebriforme]